MLSFAEESCRLAASPQRLAGAQGALARDEAVPQGGAAVGTDRPKARHLAALALERCLSQAGTGPEHVGTVRRHGGGLYELGRGACPPLSHLDGADRADPGVR